MLTDTTQAQGALFSVNENDRVPNGPLMTGNVEHNSIKIGLSAFLKMSAETGTEYLNLKIGDPRKNDPVFYGRLFRNSDKRKEKSPDYTGYIELTAEKDGPTLRVSGWKKLSRDKSRQYISLDIAPPTSSPDAGNSNTSGQVPF